MQNYRIGVDTPTGLWLDDGMTCIINHADPLDTQVRTCDREATHRIAYPRRNGRVTHIPCCASAAAEAITLGQSVTVIDEAE